MGIILKLRQYIRFWPIVCFFSIFLIVTVIPLNPLNQVIVAQSPVKFPDLLHNQNATDSADLRPLEKPFYLEHTQSTNMRVLSIDPDPIVEVSYTGNSSIGGEPSQTFGTIIDKTGPDGSVFSTGKAIIIVGDGQIITYKSESKGNYNPDGSFSDSGIIMFALPFKNSNQLVTSVESNSTNSSQLVFDNTVGIYKKSVDDKGNGLMTAWKWD